MLPVFFTRQLQGDAGAAPIWRVLKAPDRAAIERGRPKAITGDLQAGVPSLTRSTNGPGGVV